MKKIEFFALGLVKKAVFTHIILKYKSGDRSVKCKKRLIHWGAVQRNLFYLVYLESGFCNNISSQPVGVLPTKQLISNRTFSQFVRELCAKMLGARVLWFTQCHLYYEYIRIIIYITIVPAVVPIRIGIIANHVNMLCLFKRYFSCAHCFSCIKLFSLVFE